MGFIHAIATALPAHRESKTQIIEAASRWLGPDSTQFALFSRFVSSSRIEFRNFAMPLSKVLALRDPSDRAAVFEREGTALGKKVLQDVFLTSGRNLAEIGTLLFTSCSVPVIPSIDAQIVNELALPSAVTRVPIYQYGCAGGAAGLALGNKLLASSSGPVALLSVELCSLVYQAEDLSSGNLVGSALFGDGAACALLSQEQGPLEVLASQSYLIPDSTHLMGYSQKGDGAHLRLDRELPSALTKVAPAVIQNFLEQHDLTKEQIDFWLFHPGGVKVLQALEEVFAIRRSQSRWAWQVLEQFGNMSSASILFVLSQFIREHEFVPGQRALMVGIGPGLTIELSLLICH